MRDSVIFYLSKGVNMKFNNDTEVFKAGEYLAVTRHSANERIIKRNTFKKQSYAEANCLFKCFGGSFAYGTNVDNSDSDIRGVFAMREKDIYSLHNGNRINTLKFEGNDTTLFELKHFLTMIENQNPNAMELLWCDEESVLLDSVYRQMIIEQRDKITNSNFELRCKGYACNSLSIIKGYLGNESNITVDKVYKEAMNGVRIITTALDYVETGKIKINRIGINDRSLLSIRNKDAALTDIVEYLQFHALNKNSPLATTKDRIKDNHASIQETGAILDSLYYDIMRRKTENEDTSFRF